MQYIFYNFFGGLSSSFTLLVEKKWDFCYNLVMHGFIQSIIEWYFAILTDFGLWGVVVLMAMESSIFPVPSELVVPPAAYIESHAKGGAVILTVMVILAGTLGSLIGASVTYWVARWLGYPFLLKNGKYFRFTPEKIKKAEQWVDTYGAGGIFLARLIPGVRGLIPIPAGMIKMRFITFCIMTVIGAGLWCTSLTILGLIMSENMQAILASGGNYSDPEYLKAVHGMTVGSIILAVVIVILYYLGVLLQKQAAKNVLKRQTAEVNNSNDGASDTDK